MEHKPRPIVILGPTAGGKSQLAVALAQALGGQVIGADSMQVYRHMDAGTAKPSPQLRGRVPHHMIDIVEPTQRFTVAHWLEKADAAIAQIQRAGDHPVVVGGTNLYIKALLEGLFDGPGVDPVFRQQLAAHSPEQLHERLSRVDPQAAGRIHPNDRKKLIRALEVYHLSGTPISCLQNQWDSRLASSQGYRHQPILVGLNWPVDTSNRRINRRVKAMFFPERVAHTSHEDSWDEPLDSSCESLPAEVRRLQQQGLLGPQAREALGYKQVLEHLQGGISLDKAYERTKIMTRRFAKTQRTWLRRFRRVHWVSMVQQPVTDVTEKMIAIIKSEN